MIYTLSDKLILYLEKNNVLKEDREIYLYGARLVISTIIGTGLLFLVGLITNQFIEVIIYEVLMTSSRSILGGYHCKSYIQCILTYVGLFILISLLLEVYSFSDVEMSIIGIISFFITWICCPVQNINKLISSKKRRIFKIYSLLYIGLYFLSIVYLYFINSRFLDVIVCILVIINILNIGGKIDFEKNKE